MEFLNIYIYLMGEKVNEDRDRSVVLSKIPLELINNVYYKLDEWFVKYSHILRSL